MVKNAFTSFLAVFQRTREFLLAILASFTFLLLPLIVFPAFGADIKYVPLFPASVVIYVMMMATSTCRMIRKKGTIWKGRVYR